MIAQIRWHGRGGHGTVTAGIILAEAAVQIGLFARTFPNFGPFRRGNPVLVFTRLSSEPIRERGPIPAPDVVVVMDQALMTTGGATEGVKAGSVLVLNSPLSPGEIATRVSLPLSITTVDASPIALEELRAPFVSTTILGAVIAATKLVPLESIHAAVEARLPQPEWQANVRAINRAYASARCEISIPVTRRD